MASLINLAGLTMTEQEALLTNEAIFEKVYAKPILTDAHLIATGIQMKTQIPFYGMFGMVGKVAAGNCNVNEETKAIATSQKYWDPMLISFRLTHCQENIDQLFKIGNVRSRHRLHGGTWKMNRLHSFLIAPLMLRLRLYCVLARLVMRMRRLLDQEGTLQPQQI